MEASAIRGGGGLDAVLSALHFWSDDNEFRLTPMNSETRRVMMRRHAGDPCVVQKRALGLAVGLLIMSARPHRPRGLQPAEQSRTAERLSLRQKPAVAWR